MPSLCGRPRDDGHRGTFDRNVVRRVERDLARQSPTDSYGRSDDRRKVRCAALVWLGGNLCVDHLHGSMPVVVATHGPGKDQPYESSGAYPAGRADRAETAPRPRLRASAPPRRPRQRAFADRADRAGRAFACRASASDRASPQSRSSRFQATTRTPSPTRSPVWPSQRASRRRDGVAAANASHR